MRGALSICLLLCGIMAISHAWSGNYCSRLQVRYHGHWDCVRRVWWRWWWAWDYYHWYYGHCLEWRYHHYPEYYYNYYCCPGWTTPRYGSEDCSTPVCNPSCKNGGTCIRPGVCQCPASRTGPTCDSTRCSHVSPCYPGICTQTDSCDCSDGFHSVDSNKESRCLALNQRSRSFNLEIYQMQAKLSYWPRDLQPHSREFYMLLADSTNIDHNDTLWTSLRDFNRLETNISSQLFVPDLPPKPEYVGKSQFGIVRGEVQVWLSKIPVPPQTSRFESLKTPYTCEKPVSSLFPDTDLYTCNMNLTNFDRFLEHGDWLRVTYIATGGGFRELLNIDQGRAYYKNQTYQGVTREKSVEFRFDFHHPVHCSLNEKNPCRGGEILLRVADYQKTPNLTARWSHWQDGDSGLDKYAIELFSMSRTFEGGLEIKALNALSPILRHEINHTKGTPEYSWSHTLSVPGIYSLILEVADVANNTKYVRRLVIYDPHSDVTLDPAHGLNFASASPASNYSYQSNLSAPVVVTWDRHFVNRFIEENHVLGPVLQFPPSLEITERGVSGSNLKTFKKNIARENPIDDFEGRYTVEGVPNLRGIVNFEIAYVTSLNNDPAPPPGLTWNDLDQQTSYTIPLTPQHGQSYTVWVRATDGLDKSKFDRKVLTFDTTEPNTQTVQFHINQQVEGIDFSSRFELTATDRESGIAYVTWVFTRKNGSVIYNETVPGRRASKEECTKNFRDCSCTSAGDCFWFDQSYGVSNCRLMVEKESLSSEVVNVTAYVTNMAGLGKEEIQMVSNLTVLNGTQEYYPPQNVHVVSTTPHSVTLTWNFPPSCFKRVKLWAELGDGTRRVIHSDAEQFDITGLSPASMYQVRLLTEYEGQEFSDKASLTVSTAKADSTGIVVAIVIGILLLAVVILVVVVFVLFRKGKLFQQPGKINSGLQRMDHGLKSVRRASRRHLTRRQAGPSMAYQDDIYMYGEMTFDSRQPWQKDGDNLVLLEKIVDGKFASIYMAQLRGKDTSTVVAKMNKAGFTQEDALKMQAKINFMATRLEDHENVIKFLGAVTDNPVWGPVMLMEYCEKGQLDKWLVQQRGHVNDDVMEHLFRFSFGIAKGMEYLASKKVVHERLAARNVLLTNELDVKVAGFGPQHKEGDEEKATRSRVPAKWAAPEVLQNKPSTEKSDVWSYGIVLWEMFSMGEVPYSNISSTEIGTRLKGGYRMSKPEYADDTHYDLMKQCWEYKEGKRPTFTSLRATMGKHFAGSDGDEFYYDTSALKN